MPSLETYPVELLLEFLVGVVNTELLKAIPVKSLKPITDQKKKIDKTILHVHFCNIIDYYIQNNSYP